MVDIVRDYCQDYEFGGPFQSPELAAAGRLLASLVDAYGEDDRREGQALVSIMVQDKKLAGLVLAIASGIIGKLQREANAHADH